MSSWNKKSRYVFYSVSPDTCGLRMFEDVGKYSCSQSHSPFRNQVFQHSLLRISCHPLLNPLPTLLSMLLHLLWILAQFLHTVRIRNVSSLLHSWPSQHPLIPRLQRWELVDIDAGPECACHPPTISISSPYHIRKRIRGREERQTPNARYRRSCIDHRLNIQMSISRDGCSIPHIASVSRSGTG
jgi:hypothetical protein